MIFLNASLNLGLVGCKPRDQTPKEVELLEGRQLPGKSIYVVRLKGVNSRASAEALVGHTVLVPAADRPELAEGEFHLLDLVGLEARLAGNDDADRHGEQPDQRWQ